MTRVRIDGYFREYGPTGNQETSAHDVQGLLEELESTYPKLRTKLRDEAGELRRYIRVFVNGEDVRNGDGIRTVLRPSDQVELLHSTAGG